LILDQIIKIFQGLPFYVSQRTIYIFTECDLHILDPNGNEQKGFFPGT